MGARGLSTNTGLFTRREQVVFMTNNDASVWGLHTGRPRGHSREIHQRLELQTDKLFKQGYVALGWPQLGDLGALAADRETFKQQYRAVYG